MVFLTETHCTKEQHESLAKSVGMQHAAHFDKVGLEGGLALLWDDTVRVSVRDT